MNHVRLAAHRRLLRASCQYEVSVSAVLHTFKCDSSSMRSFKDVFANWNVRFLFILNGRPHETKICATGS